MPEQTAAIVLAAGASSRLGHPKQLVLYQGEPLLRRTVKLALSVGAAPVIAVTAEDGAMESSLEGLPAVRARNPDPREGMHSSLRIGMCLLAERFPSTARVLLLVCDQPLLRSGHLEALLGAPGSIAAAFYDGHLGVPAVFSREHFAALASGGGDQGARFLFRTLPVTSVPIPEAAVDIDTPDDLARLEYFGDAQSEGSI